MIDISEGDLSQAHADVATPVGVEIVEAPALESVAGPVTEVIGVVAPVEAACGRKLRRLFASVHRTGPGFSGRARWQCTGENDHAPQRTVGPAGGH